MDDQKLLEGIPKYKCHKEVGALKIKGVGRTAKGSVLHFEDPIAHPMRVLPRNFMATHNPKKGGYWVRDEDGYESFSPQEAFESSYTRIVP